MKVVLASDNAGKLREFRSLLDGSGVELLSKREAGCVLEVEEKGASFAENAFLKADAVCRATHLPALADDSGLCVDALDGAPGLYSARFTGSHADSDESRCAFLLEKLREVPDRSARFVCALCCVFPDGSVLRSEGECRGEILTERTGDNGFGYDPIFRPAGFDGSMAELTEEEKNLISHRGRALREFRKLWGKKYDQQ